MVVFDNVRKTVHVVVLADVRGADDGDELAVRHQSTCRRVDALVAALSEPGEGVNLADIATAGEAAVDYRSNFTQPEFEAAVRKCVEYIRAGDIFQVVISQRLTVDWTPPAVRDLPHAAGRESQPVHVLPADARRHAGRQFAGNHGARGRRQGDGPPAGRHPPPRRDDAEDTRLADELLADPKERAEHVMLVDLGRNDVGRVARFGSVELTDVMAIERYSHVMHITSNVTGMLARRLRCLRRAGRVPAGGHRFRRPQGAGDGDHRRNRAAPPRPLRRRRGLHRLRRQHGHLHRPADGRRPKRNRLRPSRRRHRRRQRPRRPNTRKRSTKPAACSRPSKSRRNAKPQ